jgi:hypothetical protein
VGDEDLPDHLPGDLARFLGSLHEVNPALEAVFEGALAAAAGVDLSFDDDVFADLGGGGCVAGAGDRGLSVAWIGALMILGARRRTRSVV